MLLAVNIPGINAFLLSAHGGVGWFLLPIAFIYACVKAMRVAFSAKPRLLGRCILAFAVYLVVAWPLSRAAERSVTAQIGLPLHGEVYVAATFPIGLAFVSTAD